MSDLEFTISADNLSMLRVFLDVKDKPDTANPNLPGSPTIRPQQIQVNGYIQGADDAWGISLIAVYGLKVNQQTGGLTKRRYDTTFIDPLDPESGAPEWVREIAQYWLDRMNGKVEK